MLNGLEKIPFHPDESSVLFQSRDLEKIISDPLSMVWSADRIGEIDQTYRLLNPPLPKYIIGLGRVLAGYSSNDVDNDWNWSGTWDENVASSALPEPKLLLSSRIATTIVMLFSMVPLAITARKISGDRLLIVVLVIFGLHSLALLHGRRAMSEGPLIFGISLAILGILEAEERPWLAGLGTAIAASSKLSAAVLFPVAVIAIIWRRKSQDKDGKLRLRGLLVFCAVAIIVSLLLNPVLWSNPISSIGGIWNSRVEFATQQTETLRGISPELVLETPSQRISAMIAMLFVRRPQTSEVANYVQQLNLGEQSYLSNPINTLFSGFVGGGLALFVSIFGISHSLFRVYKGEWKRKREILLLLIGTVLQASAIFLANTIPFQRYYIPLLPFTILWMGLGISSLLNLIVKAAQTMGGSSNS